jgi:hypothetical protein
MKWLLGAAVLAASITTPGLAQSSDWQWIRNVDPLSDQVRYMAFTQGENRVAAFICEPDGGMRTARVDNRLLDIELGDQRDFIWRVDQADARESRWYNVDDGGAITTGPEAIEFAAAIRNAQDRLVIGSGGVVARYSVSGSTAAIDAVFEACGITGFSE